MITLSDIRKRIKAHRSALFSRYRVRRLAVFGSCARGDQREDSDVDMLVEFCEPVGVEYLDLADELEKILQARVDLISAQGVKPRYRDIIRKDLVDV